MRPRPCPREEARHPRHRQRPVRQLSDREQLRKAVNDAHAVGAALRRISFEVISGENLDWAHNIVDGYVECGSVDKIGTSAASRSFWLDQQHEKGRR
jgi:hypothetical protein